MEFQSYRSYHWFEREVKQHSRYIRSRDSEQFLNTIKETSENRKYIIKLGEEFWRARLGHDLGKLNSFPFLIPTPYEQKNMKPLPDKAHEGRVNPKGIACLYLATNKRTAISEVRPWIGAKISIAKFRTTKDLKIVDCSTERDWPSADFRNEDPGPEEKEKAVWSDINEAFSNPVTPKDDTAADYAPTQIIAELFKNDGVDGIKYRSAFGTGNNIALFDVNSAEPETLYLYVLKDLKIDYEPDFYEFARLHDGQPVEIDWFEKN